MKIAIVEIAPELAAEAFGLLREAGALVLGSQASAPALRIVVSHDLLPPECEPAKGKPAPVVMMTVKSDDERRLKLQGFQLNPWATQPRRAR